MTKRAPELFSTWRSPKRETNKASPNWCGGSSKARFLKPCRMARKRGAQPLNPEKSMSFYKNHAPKHREHQRELSLPELEGMKALRDEAEIPSRQWQEEVRR